MPVARLCERHPDRIPMRNDDLGAGFRPARRTSQIIYGERQHLVTVLKSITEFPDADLDAQHPLLVSLIEARTEELDKINPDWDDKVERARNSRTTANELADLALAAPADDWLLLRVIAENPNAPATVLAYLSHHPYDSIAEVIARHPNADAETLERLAADPERPLWVLVAANGATPGPLRQKLLQRLKAMSDADVPSRP